MAQVRTRKMNTKQYLIIALSSVLLCSVGCNSQRPEKEKKEPENSENIVKKPPVKLEKSYSFYGSVYSIDGAEDTDSHKTFYSAEDTIYSNSYALSLAYIRPLEKVCVSTESTTSEYRVEFHSEKGGLLNKFCFNLTPTCFPRERIFEFYTIVPNETKKMEFKKNDDVLLEYVITEYAPAVKDIRLEQKGDILNISWKASDLDSTNLQYDILYKSKEMENWKFLVTGHRSTNYGEDLAWVPKGTDCLIKVVADDGFNMGEAISNDTFSIREKIPIIQISYPPEDYKYVENETTAFEALGYDMEDGDICDAVKQGDNLTGSPYVWTIDGKLKYYGRIIELKLPAGEHSIEVSVTDNAKNTVSTEKKICIQKQDSEK